jgi:GGDEF domain-containing protein
LIQVTDLIIDKYIHLLTKIPSRAYVDIVASKYFDEDFDFSIINIDLNNFKQVNDDF